MWLPRENPAVEIVEIAREAANPIDRFGSTGAYHLGRVGFAGDGGWTLLSLAPGGTIGRHPTVLTQLFVVLEGSGWACGEDGNRQPIRAGQAALWSAGEEHESGTDEGMRVAVLEAASITVR
jgi:hypothetical protein